MRGDDATGSLFEVDTPNYASASFPPPRAFQETAHERLREGARAKHKNQLIMAPTGAGKLYLGMRIAHEALIRGKRAIFVADRTTLINQASEAADRYGLAAHGIMQADHPRTDKSMPFQICSAQTMARRPWPSADVIIVDEAHTQLKAWVDHAMESPARFVGLSATPFSKGLGKIFTNLINATTAHELTLAGVLVPMRVLSCVRPDMEGAATAGGEWTDKAAEERGMAIVGDVVDEWIKHAENRKTIVFGSTIAHCEEMARQFNESDVNAALFTSHTDELERKALLEDFRRPDSRIRVLISVEALAKGFDVPDVGCVVDARPLRKSLSTAIQMWGRGLRASPETGKVDCLLLDHSGNILRFAKDYADIFFNGLSELDSGEKLDGTVRKEPEEKTPKGCPQCGAIPYVGRCMSCGHVTQKAAVIEAVNGVMREVQIGSTKAKQPAYVIWQQACAYARAHSAPEKQAGRAANIYRDIVGLWPDRASMRFESTPNAPITREVLNQIKFNNIRFSRSRAA